MMRGALTFFALVSVIFFPWPLTLLVTLAGAFVEPLVPLAVGLFADTLYYTPQAATVPLFTLYGALATILAFFVRSRLRTGIING